MTDPFFSFDVVDDECVELRHRPPERPRSQHRRATHPHHADEVWPRDGVVVLHELLVEHKRQAHQNRRRQDEQHADELVVGQRYVQSGRLQRHTRTYEEDRDPLHEDESSPEEDPGPDGRPHDRAAVHHYVHRRARKYQTNLLECLVDDVTRADDNAFTPVALPDALLRGNEPHQHHGVVVRQQKQKCRRVRPSVVLDHIDQQRLYAVCHKEHQQGRHLLRTVERQHRALPHLFTRLRAFSAEPPTATRACKTPPGTPQRASVPPVCADEWCADA
mmetsp:Transcript_25397/g.62894  ORF Transcript_25397/g.62894 Transcript_25397/m.62894 type:complete len:275 (+) Transcript_25397:2-826(+)